MCKLTSKELQKFYENPKITIYKYNQRKNTSKVEGYWEMYENNVNKFDEGTKINAKNYQISDQLEQNKENQKIDKQQQEYVGAEVNNLNDNIKMKWFKEHKTNRPKGNTAMAATEEQAAEENEENENAKEIEKLKTNWQLQQKNKLTKPFEQLGGFFNNKELQLQLQQYTNLFYYNAERQTKFHLYTIRQSEGNATTIANTNATIAAARLSGRVLNVIGAAFGVHREYMNFKGMLAVIKGINIDEIQLHNVTSLRQSRFNATKPTRLLIHGWLGGEHASVYQALIPAYLKISAGDYNVIAVDWGRGSFADYLTASYRVKSVGKTIAKFIDFLHQEGGLHLADLHLIGFSMGAHIAGIAGKHVHSGRLPAIFALDPALPFFHYERPEERIAITDADYVQVIHTSAGTYGYDRPLGHADFYVNYGNSQPGCFLIECSHFRAFEVFTEALSADMVGNECMANYWQDMIKQRRCLMSTGKQLTMGADVLTGHELSQRRGVYYVSTQAKPPFMNTASDS